MKTLTTSARRRITADWQNQFPALGVYAPLRLLRRVGPLLEGIALERNSGNDVYRPTFHVHCLLHPFTDVSLTLAQALRTERNGAPDDVAVVHHDAKFCEAAARLERQSPLPLTGDLHMADVLDAYRKFALRPNALYDTHLLYRDMALLCGWSGRAEDAHAIIDEGFDELGRWPAEVVRRIGGREEWRDQLKVAVDDRKRLITIVDEQIAALNVGGLPVASLVVD